MNITKEHIDRLHILVRETASDRDYDRAREHARLTRRVVERNCYGFLRAFRRFSCDDCDVYPRPDANARARTRAGGHVVVRCDCGATKRYPY